MARLGDLASFFHELQYQLSAGMGIVQALSILESLPPPSLRRIIPKLREEVSRGSPLSSAMKKFPDVFSPLMVNLILAGEASGKLADACGNLGNLIERDMEMRRKLSIWTLYPKLLAVIALFLIFVFPPLISWLLLGNKEAGMLALRSLGVAALFVALYFVVVKLIIPPRIFSRVLDILKSSLPGVSSLAGKFALARFLTTLAHLYMAGVPPAEALNLAAESSGSLVIAKKVQLVAPQTRQGEKLSLSLQRAGILPPSVMSMVIAGEEGGRLPEALELCSQRLEQEAIASSHRWIIAVAIGVYLLVALSIAYYVVSFYAGYARMLTQ